MEKNEVQKLHIKMSVYQYSIILVASLLSYFLYYTHTDNLNAFYELAPITVCAISGFSLVLRFIPDIIYRKSIFVENFAIKIFLDYFIRILVFIISAACTCR